MARVISAPRVKSGRIYLLRSQTFSMIRTRDVLLLAVQLQVRMVMKILYRRLTIIDAPGYLLSRASYCFCRDPTKCSRSVSKPRAVLLRRTLVRHRSTLTRATRHIPRPTDVRLRRHSGVQLPSHPPTRKPDAWLVTEPEDVRAVAYQKDLPTMVSSWRACLRASVGTIAAWWNKTGSIS